MTNIKNIVILTRQKKYSNLKSTKYLFLLIFILLFSGSNFAFQNESDKLPRPKLVVGIVIDQMRWDYLYRYYERYGSDGFKRLLDEGFSNENTYISHLPTSTGIGHSTIYTGSVPAVHGITGNSFTFNSTGKGVNCVGDVNVQSIGTSSNDGQKSPVNLLVNTIGDELKLATNFRSKVIGIAIKDRGAILPAGHAADAAYWLDYKRGKWITSTYYMDKLPQWVDSFNAQNLAEKYLAGDWNTIYDINTYAQSTADNKPYEGLLKGQESPTFPIKTSELYTSEDYSVITGTPFGNSLTLDFAKKAIEEEELGARGETDLLAVSLSSTDAVGHRLGINSIEVEDTYLRLDKDIAEFLNYLDKTQGKGNYTVFLTADHGAAHNTQFLQEHKMPVYPADLSMMKKEMNELLEEKFQIKDVIRNVGASMVRFNYKLINENKLDEQEIRDVCMEYLRRDPDVLFVVDFNKVGDAAIPEEIKSRMVNSHHPERSGGIQYILNPNSGPSTQKGTSHSNWNPYDAKIPLVWMGWGIKKGGRSVKQVHMTDIAPTVSSLLRIQPPNGNIGKALNEVLD